MAWVLLVLKMRLTAKICMLIELLTSTYRMNFLKQASFVRTQKKLKCWTRHSYTKVVLGALSTSQCILVRLRRQLTRRTISAPTTILTIAFQPVTPAGVDMHPCLELRPKLWLSHPTIQTISSKISTQKASLSTEYSLTSIHQLGRSIAITQLSRMSTSLIKTIGINSFQFWIGLPITFSKMKLRSMWSLTTSHSLVFHNLIN